MEFFVLCCKLSFDSLCRPEFLLRIDHCTTTGKVTGDSTIKTNCRTGKTNIVCMETPAITTIQTGIVCRRRCPVLHSLLLLWDEGLRRRLQSCLCRCRRWNRERWLRKRRYVLVRVGLSVVWSPARLPLWSVVSESPATTCLLYTSPRPRDS